MDVYQYIAESNPYVSKQIIERFGYRCKSHNMAQNLRELIAKEGKPALVLLMKNHPDRDIILELFQPEKSNFVPDNTFAQPDTPTYLNMSGETNSLAKNVENNFSLIFLAGMTMLALAIIKK